MERQMGQRSIGGELHAPRRRQGGLLVLALLGVLILFGALSGPPQVFGQSILSRESSPLILPLADVPRQEIFRRTAWELFEAVQKGWGTQIYGLLRERMAGDLAAENADDAEEFHRLYLLNLMRAGQGWAPPEEIEEFARTFIQNYPDDGRFPQAFYFLNQALARQGQPLESSFFFDDGALASLPDWMQSRYLRLLADAKVAESKPLEAAAYLVQEIESEGTLGESSPFDVEELLDKATSATAVENFLAAYPDVEWLQERASFLKLRALVNQGELQEALLRLSALEVEGELGTSEARTWAADLKLRIRGLSRLQRARVGVLLPLSSRSAVLRQLAHETLDGLRMAAQFPEGTKGASELSRLLGQDLPGSNLGKTKETRKSRPHFELVVRDTANSGKLSSRLVRELVEEEQVMAIIGPIARNESEMAAETAETLGVPLVSLSISMKLPEASRFTFRHSKSHEQEVADLVRYAMDYMHLRRFAILYPETTFGRRMMQLFWDTVQARQGKVTAVAAFTPSVVLSRLSLNKVGLKKTFERFAGVDRYVSQEDRHWLEVADDDSPDPRVDFDALFIPIGPTGIQDLQLIAPYPVTVDAENVVLLGSRFWNDPSVLVASDGKMQGAVFLDSYDSVSAHPKMVAFQARHRTFYGHRLQYRLPTYYTALGYDTANMLMGLLESGNLHSREQLRDGLLTMEPFFGVTGHTRFLRTGEAEKESMFFQLGEKNIVRLRN